MALRTAMSATTAGSEAWASDDESGRTSFEGALAIGMQVTAMIHALHAVESVVSAERDLAALADAQEGLDMVCRQMRRTRTRLGLRAAE